MRRAAFVAVVVLCVGFAGGAIWAAVTADDSVAVCVNDRNGSIALAGADDECPRNSTLLRLATHEAVAALEARVVDLEAAVAGPPDPEPGVLAATIAPAIPTTIHPLICSSSGGTEPFSFAWTVNGATAGFGEVLAAVNFARGDLVECTVTDRAGTIASASVVIANAAPVVTGITISPPDPTTEDTLLCSATASDVDGDPVIVAYAWNVNDTPVSNSQSLGPAAFGAGDVVQCEATPFDGASFGDTAYAVVTVAVGDFLVAISPNPAVTTDTLQCGVTGGTEPYTFGWYVNGTQVGSGSVLSPSNFVKGNVVRCEISAGGETRFDTLVIQNSPPVVTSVTIEPANPSTGQNLVCSATVVDDDSGDILIVELAWTVDGTFAGDGPTLASESTAPGNTVRCTATANDGTDQSTPQWDEAVVGE